MSTRKRKVAAKKTATTIKTAFKVNPAVMAKAREIRGPGQVVKVVGSDEVIVANRVDR